MSAPIALRNCFPAGSTNRRALELARALRATAERLSVGADYRWSDLGRCNCGHLAQTLTRLSEQEIREFALQRPGIWAEQIVEYCPTSGYPLDVVIGSMLEVGATLDDIRHLERLSSPRVLKRIPVSERLQLSYRDRHHVARYMIAWAELLEEQSGAGEGSVSARPSPQEDLGETPCCPREHAAPEPGGAGYPQAAE
ncbi:MAG: hypothetical protein R3B89_07595 [Polyangiaceae bacterium]